MGFLSLLDLNVLKNWLRLERISLCSSGPSPSPLSLCQEDEFVFWCVFPLSPLSTSFWNELWVGFPSPPDLELLRIMIRSKWFFLTQRHTTELIDANSPRPPLSIAPGDQVNSPYSWGSRWGPPSPWALVGHPGCPVSFLFLWTPTGWLPIWPMCWAPSFTVQNW